jgi:cytochrome c-type biogenesis protein CcmH/NrfG
MAATELKLVAGVNVVPVRAEVEPATRAPITPEQQARRWNDYGIGLLEQMQYGAAAEAFRQAAKLNPQNSDLFVNASIAELRTEQFGIDRAQIRKAALLLDEALRINPGDGRARYFRALVARGEGKPQEAAVELSKLAREFPRDREVQRQLGQTLYLLGRVAEARVAFESILSIDPNDAGAYQFLSPIYASEGRKEEASGAQELYLLWRDDPLADIVAARFFAANPQWAEERVWSHAHGADSPLRPTLTSKFAAPDR